VDVAPVRAEAEPSSSKRRDLALRISGLSVFGLGAVTLLTGGIYVAKHGHDGRSLRAVTLESEEYAARIDTWRSSRERPLQIAIPGAALASIGAGLLATSDVDVPVWVAALSGAAAVSMLAWGAVEVAHGEACNDTANDQLECSGARDRGDRGSVLMVSAAPLAVLPIALLIRHWISPRSAPESRAKGHLTPGLVATRGVLGLSLEGAWF
jgi:hypothetical protein